IPEAWGNAFYMGAHGYITGKAAVAWFASAHSHSFVVLVFHFLFRLLAVNGSPHIQIFSKRWFYGVLFGCVFLVGGAWYFVLYYLYDAVPFVVRYMQPVLREHAIGTSLPLQEYSTAVFWTNGTFSGPRWKPIFGVFVMASTMGAAYGFMAFAAYEIRWCVKSKKKRKRTK
ncbi:hypothetical protein PMAYCL1PPCAC_32158, partial [Pristionchus mayeri]